MFRQKESVWLEQRLVAFLRTVDMCSNLKYLGSNFLWVKLPWVKFPLSQITLGQISFESNIFWVRFPWVKFSWGQFHLGPFTIGSKNFGSSFCIFDIPWVKIPLDQNVLGPFTIGSKKCGSNFCNFDIPWVQFPWVQNVLGPISLVQCSLGPISLDRMPWTKYLGSFYSAPNFPFQVKHFPCLSFLLEKNLGIKRFNSRVFLFNKLVSVYLWYNLLLIPCVRKIRETFSFYPNWRSFLGKILFSL